MKLVGLLAVCALLTACATTSATTEFAAPQDATPQDATPSPNSMRFAIGGRSLDKSDWDPVENQVAFAFEFVHEPYGAPLGFEIGSQVGESAETVHVSGSGSDADLYSLVSELYGGVHKTFLRDSMVQPFVGAGLTLVYASFNTHFHSFDTSDEDTTAGLYAHGGVQVRMARNLFIGFDLRGVFGTDINLFGANGNADYGQATVFLGVGF